ncbi:MAG TPA: LysR family transcriptional regulator [Kofleriaceae bacterium]|nr:LysR family transcriptional regulator [Kofleriaceae bacterium]
MDRLDELAIFVAIVDEGSLAAAGRKLRRSPPAVTRALAALEERVGARLVERTTRRSRPTEAGRRLAEHARQVLAGYGDAVGEVAAGPVRGVLRVTAPLVFGRRHVTPIVASFLDAYPGVRVDLVLSDRNLDLVGDGLDVALRIGQLADSGLVARRVGEVRRMLVASPSYLAGRAAVRAPRDLVRHDVVFTATRAGPVEWRFGGAAHARVVRLVPRLIVNEVDAALLAVRAGRGIARALSYQVADDLASGALVRLLPELEPPALPVQLVVPSARHLAPKARSFVDHAARALETLGVIRAMPAARRR